MAESIILICTSDAGKADVSNSIPPSLAHNQPLRYQAPQILALFPVSEFQGMCAFLSTLVQQETIIKRLKQLCVSHRNSDLLFFARKQKASCWMIRRGNFGKSVIDFLKSWVIAPISFFHFKMYEKRDKKSSLGVVYWKHVFFHSLNSINHFTIS